MLDKGHGSMTSISVSRVDVQCRGASHTLTHPLIVLFLKNKEEREVNGWPDMRLLSTL
jgi:uncharacterized Zn-finger protein